MKSKTIHYVLTIGVIFWSFLAMFYSFWNDDHAWIWQMMTGIWSSIALVNQYQMDKSEQKIQQLEDIVKRIESKNIN